jgi:parvulin-like peptidyl-prolyl isomerase
MRQLLPFILLLVLVAACTETSFRTQVDTDERVTQFLTLFPTAEYAETTFREGQLTAISDLITQDCAGIEMPSKVIRATYTATAATLAAYLDAQGEILCLASKLNQDAFVIEKGDPANANGALVSVNGESITEGDLQDALSAIPEASRSQTDIGVLLNQLVNRALLRQAASDVVVSQSEIDTAVENGWKTAGFEDEAALASFFEENGGSIDLYREQVEQDLKVQQLLVDAGLTEVDVSEEAARNFYLQNTNAFLVSEQVQFRQLFIATGDNLENAQTRLENALIAINEGLDFCAAIERYSDDTDSKERCGEYVAARGVLSPDIEAAIFSLDAEQSTVVQSDAGFHVIVVVAKQPSMVIPYEQAATQVRGLLRNQVVQQNVNLYLLTLRAEAEIIDYS